MVIRGMDKAVQSTRGHHDQGNGQGCAEHTWSSGEWTRLCRAHVVIMIRGVDKAVQSTDGHQGNGQGCAEHTWSS